jgi:hypothetical protein
MIAISLICFALSASSILLGLNRLFHPIDYENRWGLIGSWDPYRRYIGRDRTRSSELIKFRSIVDLVMGVIFFCVGVLVGANTFFG